MKRIIVATGLICASTLQMAMAELPVTISTPSPAITKWYSIGDPSTTVTYTITNNVPGHSFPITVSGLSGALQRVTATDQDCGDLLSSGPSTCHVAVEISPRASDLGEKIHQVLAIGYRGRGPLTQDIEFSVPPILTTAGSTASFGPAFYSSFGGGDWATPASMSSSLPSYGILNGTSCTGHGIGTLCMSAGQDYTEDQPPLVLTSVNGGVAWSKQTPPGLPTFGFLYGTGCTGEGDNALCVATGEDFTGDQPPFLVVSRRENGNTLLTRLALKDLDSSGVLWGVGCTGSGSSAICTAVGQDYADNLPPLLIVSTDGGSNWTRSTISGMPASGYFNAASCTGSGSSAICIAVGQDYKGDQPPLLYVSRDGAQNWSRVTSSDFPATGVFWGSSCTGSGDDAVCTAVGEDDTSGTAPLLLITRDGGRNWAKNTPSEMTTSGALWVTACTDGGVHAVCTIAGQDNTGKQPPILFVTKDGAQSWTKLVPTGLPIYGYIDATSCTGSGATAICTAIGQDYSGSQPAVIFENKDGVDSMDQSALWVEQTLPETKNGVMLVASGASGAGSSSNSSSGGAGKAVLRHQ